MRSLIMALAATLSLAACASSAPAREDVDLSLLTGGRVSAAQVSRIAAEAAQHPLGSEANPIRVSMPEGERAYLARLRCSDGSAPAFERHGSAGAGPYGSILDIYAVICPSGEPRESTLWMDMYHPQHRETAAPPGFTLAAR
jgi:hypothetical protein